MRIWAFIVALCLCMTVFATDASASTISFRHEGWGDISGTIGGRGFQSEHFVILATGDTANRQTQGSAYFIDHDSASIMIDGVGTFNFITGTRTFNNQNTVVVGFSRAGNGGLDLYNGPQDAGLPTWDMDVSFGPIGGVAAILQWMAGDINTSGGILDMNGGQLKAEFEANVPEPASMALLLMGLTATGVVRRKRRQSV